MRSASLMLVLLLGISTSQPAAADQAEDIARLRKIGGVVTLDDAKEVVAMNLRDAELTPKDIELLPGFTRLTKLEFLGSYVTDASLDSIAKVTSLKDLVLENTEITNDGLARLKPLQNLRLINCAAALS